MNITDALLLHALAIAGLLFYIYLRLRERGLFHWLSAGFWVWGAIFFYCLAVPLYQWFFGDPFFIETRLAVTEGIPRLLWITFCIALGSYFFFFAYLRAKPAQIRLGLPQDTWPTGTTIIIALALLGAAYCMVTYRGALGLERPRLMIVNSRFIGGVTGYQYVLHMLALFPIALLILRKSTRYWGYALAAIFFVGRLDDKMDRMSIVSLLLSLTMITTALRQSQWPRAFLILGLLVITAILIGRGHSSFSKYHASGNLTTHGVLQEVKKSPDGTMLNTLWLESYLVDRSGYTYGLPLVDSVLFGFLPRKYFPWKSDVMENLFHYRPKGVSAVYGSEMMYGAKSMVFGSFYGYGGVFGIIVGMFILGFLGRKLDGLISSHSPLVLRTLGIVWLSLTWMIFGSSVEWGVSCLFLSGLSFMGIVIVNTMRREQKLRPVRKFLRQPLTP
jgi:hypothetical protein